MAGAGAHHTFLLVLSLILAAWGFFLFFQGAYFSAGFYGVPVPFWAQWIGQLPLWAFDVIDTIMVAIVLLAFFLSRKASPRRMNQRGQGEVSTVLAWLLVLGALAVVLYLVFGITLPILISALKGFFGVK